jgi:hypothetical protein
VVCGVWCVVCGVWCVVCGVWCVVCGVWCVVCGVIKGGAGGGGVRRASWLGWRAGAGAGISPAAQQRAPTCAAAAPSRTGRCRAAAADCWPRCRRSSLRCRCAACGCEHAAALQGGLPHYRARARHVSSPHVELGRCELPPAATEHSPPSPPLARPCLAAHLARSAICSDLLLRCGLKLASPCACSARTLLRIMRSWRWRSTSPRRSWMGRHGCSSNDLSLMRGWKVHSASAASACSASFRSLRRRGGVGGGRGGRRQGAGPHCLPAGWLHGAGALRCCCCRCCICSRCCRRRHHVHELRATGHTGHTGRGAPLLLECVVRAAQPLLHRQPPPQLVARRTPGLRLEGDGAQLRRLRLLLGPRVPVPGGRPGLRQLLDAAVSAAGPGAVCVCVCGGGGGVGACRRQLAEPQCCCGGWLEGQRLMVGRSGGGAAGAEVPVQSRPGPPTRPRRAWPAACGSGWCRA